MGSLCISFRSDLLAKDLGGGGGLRGCIQKFPDWIYEENYAYNNKYSLRSNTKGYGSKTH
jgi:hypothetical protein